MEVEFYNIDRRNAWNSFYQEIRNESNNFSYIIKDAKKLENKYLNRYRDVNPFDHSRVRLRRGDKDYINASLVDISAAGRSYILTQGPLPTTTGHFWLMVWEQNSKAIVMLNRVIEKNTVKCHQYWPVESDNTGSDTLLLSDVSLKIKFLNEMNDAYYSVRRFLLTDLESCNSREILQFHYTTWPDFGVPESPGAFLNFLFTVRKYGVLDHDCGPPVVHCSAGIGRSGTFCLVDSCLVLIENNHDLNSINVRQQLLEMRHYRMGLIQTPDQLRFSYLAIIEGAKIVISDKINHHTMALKDENCGEMFQTNSLHEENSGSRMGISINTSEMSPSLPNQSSQNSFSELRKRTRKEREEKMATIVQNIKKKQREAEIWEKRRSFFKFSFGLVLIIGIGYFVYKNYSKS